MTTTGPYLHLDGVAAYMGAMERYFPKGSESCFKGEVLSRIFALVQAVLALAFTTVKQAVRGVTFLLGGILTFDFGRIKFAFKDFVSIIVQAIVLPVLGLISTVMPLAGIRLSYRLVSNDTHKMMSTQEIGNGEHIVRLPRFLTQPVKGAPGFIAKLLLHMTAPVQTLAQMVHSLVRALITFEFHQEMLKFPLYFLMAPCVSACSCEDHILPFAHGYLEV